jgi:hypothetical protein
MDFETRASRRPEREFSDMFDGEDSGVSLPTMEATADENAPEAPYLPLVQVAPPSPSHGTRVTQATQPVERIRRLDADPPVVTVTIGRLEVRAVAASTLAPAPASARPTASKTLSLEDYLEQRHGAVQR